MSKRTHKRENTQWKENNENYILWLFCWYLVKKKRKLIDLFFVGGVWWNHRWNLYYILLFFCFVWIIINKAENCGLCLQIKHIIKISSTSLRGDWERGTKLYKKEFQTNSHFDTINLRNCCIADIWLWWFYLV